MQLRAPLQSHILLGMEEIRRASHSQKQCVSLLVSQTGENRSGQTTFSCILVFLTPLGTSRVYFIFKVSPKAGMHDDKGGTMEEAVPSVQAAWLAFPRLECTFPHCTVLFRTVFPSLTAPGCSLTGIGQPSPKQGILFSLINVSILIPSFEVGRENKITFICLENRQRGEEQGTRQLKSSVR